MEERASLQLKDLKQGAQVNRPRRIRKSGRAGIRVNKRLWDVDYGLPKCRNIVKGWRKLTCDW
jgi:hypothetical protein